MCRAKHLVPCKSLPAATELMVTGGALRGAHEAASDKQYEVRTSHSRIPDVITSAYQRLIYAKSRPPSRQPCSHYDNVATQAQSC